MKPSSVRWSGRNLRLLTGLIVIAGLVGGLLTACTPSSDQPKVLTVLASSELSDLEPLLPQLRKATGITLRMEYQSTLTASQAVAAGQDQHDLAWFASDRWLRLRLDQAGRGEAMPPSSPTMLSPVVIALDPAVAARLHRQSPDGVTWADIADAAASGRLHFGMADPHRSDSGLSALVGVATAAADTGGGAIRLQDIGCDRLQGLFSGQVLTAPSTAELTDRFLAAQRAGPRIDGLISYESVILSMNAAQRPRTPLEIVYPTDGMVMSDYPLLRLNRNRTAEYNTVLKWLRSPAVQKQIMERTLRRPIDPGVARDPRLRASVSNALRFPAEQAVVDRLLTFYRGYPDGDGAGAGETTPGIRPAAVIFLLDFSGSMKGRRIAALRSAVAGLSGADRSRDGEFLRFHRGETISVVRFGGRVLDERRVTYRDEDDLRSVRAALAGDDFDGRTAIWSALDHGYAEAARITARAGSGPVSIVLMTDGENNAGMEPAAFARRYRALPRRARAVPTFAVRYGDARTAELRRVAKLTGGQLVETRNRTLLQALQETRGCAGTGN